MLVGEYKVGGEKQVRGRTQGAGELVVVTNLLDVIWVIAGFLLEFAARPLERVFARFQSPGRQVIDHPADGVTVLAGEDDLTCLSYPDSCHRLDRALQVEIGPLFPLVLERVDHNPRPGVVEYDFTGDYLIVCHAIIIQLRTSSSPVHRRRSSGYLRRLPFQGFSSPL